MRSAAESYTIAMFTIVPAGPPLGLMFVQSYPDPNGTESGSTAPRADAVPEKSPAREPTESSTATVAARRSPRKSLPLGSLSVPGYLAFARSPERAARSGAPAPSSTTAEQQLNNEGRIAGHPGGSPIPVAAEALRKL